MRSFYVSELLVLSVSWGCGDDDAATGGQGTGAQGTGAAGGQGTTTSGGGGEGGWDPRFNPLVEALQADLEDSSAYGVSVAVMEGGEITFAAAFGSKDAEGTQPLTPQTLMQIGSTTKQLTATALLRKVEAGEVALDDTLEETLPELEFALDGTWDDQISMHHLLSHQGAFYDLTEWNKQDDDERLASYSYGTFSEQIFLMAPPGSFWNYSNPNFIMAGLVTETLDTRKWPDIMREDIFTPLGMTRSFLRKSEVEADGDYSLSYGITLSGDGPTDVSMTQIADSAWTRPAGLMWSTPTQQMSWAKFILHGNPNVLSDALREEITTEQVDTLYQSGTYHYGYGMFVGRGHLTNDGTWYPMTVWDHGGNTLSFTNTLLMLPEHDFAIAITTSGYGTDFDHSVDVALTSLVDVPPPGDAPMYEVDPTQFVRHVGTYDDPFNVGQVIIEQVGDDLTVSLPDVDAIGIPYGSTLQAISSNIFLLDIDGQVLDITFVPVTAEGDSRFIRNRAFVAGRPEPTMMAAPRSSSSKITREGVERVLLEARLDPKPIRRLAGR